ncbi:hypothetical protein LJC00_00260 [Dysgonomonas sp. OttesenSCG-928-M03]|nr:hypothetical protein [Dysgonomonas sp. OttesenSCG-928-M03]
MKTSIPDIIRDACFSLMICVIVGSESFRCRMNIPTLCVRETGKPRCGNTTLQGGDFRFRPVGLQA